MRWYWAGNHPLVRFGVVVAFMTEPMPVSAHAAESTVSRTIPVNASFAALVTVPTGSHTAPTGPQSHGLIGLACAWSVCAAD